MDVGLKTTGYVVCEVNGLNIELLSDGQIVTSTSSSLPVRLNDIFTVLTEVIVKSAPRVLVLEKLYSHYKHPSTLGTLAQVRGIVALLSARYDMAFYQYSPTRARKAMLGRGNVTSSQVKKMTGNYLPVPLKSRHIADAFSLVVAFSHENAAGVFHDQGN